MKFFRRGEESNTGYVLQLMFEYYRGEHNYMAIYLDPSPSQSNFIIEQICPCQRGRIDVGCIFYPGTWDTDVEEPENLPDWVDDPENCPQPWKPPLNDIEIARQLGKRIATLRKSIQV